MNERAFFMRDTCNHGTLQIRRSTNQPSGHQKGTMVPSPHYQLTNSPPRRRTPADGRGMLQKRAAAFILDDVALPSMRRAHEEKNDAECASCHSEPDLADEGDGIKIPKSATIRYQPEPLTKEELDFFLSLDFEADDNDTSIATGNTRASFPLDTAFVEKYSANGLQDSSSTLQSNVSSLSAAVAKADDYLPNQSFSTLDTSSSRSSTHGSAFANQVQGQELKLISTMKRSAESREAVQRIVRNFPPAPLNNATFDIKSSGTHCNRNTSHPSGNGMNTIETKRSKP